MYVTRRDALWRKLAKKGGIELTDKVKGYITLRDAHISERAWDTLTTWTKNVYDYPVIIENLRKIERPVPGKPASVALYQCDEEESSFAILDDGDDDDDAQAIPMAQSLFVSPENFLGDEALEQDLETHMYDENIVYLAGDIPPTHVFDEEQAQAVCAN